MKTFFLLIVVFFFSANLVVAQDLENSSSICEASKACGKACRMKEVSEDADTDPAYQKLLVKCAEDVAKNLKLIQ